MLTCPYHLFSTYRGLGSLVVACMVVMPYCQSTWQLKADVMRLSPSGCQPFRGLSGIAISYLELSLVQSRTNWDIQGCSDMVHESIITSRSRSPICPWTTWDIQGCSQHCLWEHHQSQVRDVPSVLGQPWTSKLVSNVVYETIVSPRFEMSHLS